MVRRADRRAGTAGAAARELQRGRDRPGHRQLPRRLPWRVPAKENRPTQESFHCLSCGHTAHADTVGALNVLRAGLVRRDANPA
ncbi:zinc ribbon domain-containing protein [Streptomyces avermitilis]|uniref:zinc ribbon domain-containing protein n=1 Tax=Streptomyces avermitilis TaxID=33903 RepID=UPI0036C757A2